MRQTLLMANWKMHGTFALIQEWIHEVLPAINAVINSQLVLCPPAVYLSRVAELAKNSQLAWGAQDVSEHLSGAFTGQISSTMLKDVGCRYVIIGHSERRQYNHESNELIAAKFAAAQQAELIPVLCVGETLTAYQADQTEQVVTQQLAIVLEQVGIAAFARAVIAYEPVWAIGTGLAATPAQAQKVHALIRAQLAQADITIANQVSILYGGSVKPENAAELFAQPDIDGGLVGGASLDAKQFIKIAKY